MKPSSNKEFIKDGRDEKIEKDAKVYALEWMTTITQVLTIMCLLKKIRHGKGLCRFCFLELHLYFFMNLSSMKQSRSRVLE